MISFEPSEDQQLIQSTVRSYSADELRPRLREFERERGLPDDVLVALHDMGVTTLTVPEAAGGAGLSLLTAMIAEEELAFGDTAVPYAMGGPGSFGAVVLELGTPEQQRRFLEPFTRPEAWGRRGAFAFSEARPAAQAGLTTTAVRSAEGWMLTGRKSFVLNGGVAQAIVVVAQVDPTAGWDGVEAFVVESGAEGLRFGPRVATIGLDAVPVADVLLESCFVPEQNRLSGAASVGRGLTKAFGRITLHAAARAVGLSRAAFEIAREYCETRTAFGKPIGHFQAVAFTLADRLMDVESARWMLWRAAARVGRGARTRCWEARRRARTRTRSRCARRTTRCSCTAARASSAISASRR